MVHEFIVHGSWFMVHEFMVHGSCFMSSWCGARFSVLSSVRIVISTSAWPRSSLSTRFAREEKSPGATRSRLSAPRPPTPFSLAILALLEIMRPLEISPRVTIVPGPHPDRVLVEMTLQAVFFPLQRRRNAAAPLGLGWVISGGSSRCRIPDRRGLVSLILTIQSMCTILLVMLSVRGDQ
jgi:hypothetical protein